MRSPADEPLPQGAKHDLIDRLKDSLRREAIALREGMPPDVRAAWSEALRERITTLRCWKDARTVGLFAAIRGEVDLLPLVQTAVARGKRAVFPRVDRAGRTLVFFGVHSAGDLVPGAFGVPEPPADPARTVAAADIDLLLVPGVAFDARGGRLGFGGGFYDRLLGAAGRAADAGVLALGAVFERQILPEVPMAPSDRRVDALVTESRSLWCDGRDSRDRIL